MSNFANKRLNLKTFSHLLLIVFCSLSIVITYSYFLNPERNWASSFPKGNVMPSPTPTEEIHVSEYAPINPNSTNANPEYTTPPMGAALLVAQENGFMNCDNSFASGKNLLIIQNTTSSRITLNLRELSGAIEKEIYLEPSPIIWKGVIILSQGQYELFAEGQAQFNCSITVN